MCICLSQFYAIIQEPGFVNFSTFFDFFYFFYFWYQWVLNFILAEKENQKVLFNPSKMNFSVSRHKLRVKRY